jgi:hypothetical protein
MNKKQKFILWMGITAIVLIGLCFLAGCAERGEQKNTVKTKAQGYKGLPVELRTQSENGLPVEVQVKGDEGVPVKLDLQDGKLLPVEVKTQDDKAIPVKLDMQGDESLRVEVNIQSDKEFPVKLDMEGDKGLLVEIKVPQVALVFIAIAVGTILLIAIVTCFVAIGAARSARAACRSSDTIKKIQQQSK